MRDSGAAIGKARKAARIAQEGRSGAGGTDGLGRDGATRGRRVAADPAFWGDPRNAWHGTHGVWRRVGGPIYRGAGGSSSYGGEALGTVQRAIHTKLALQV